MKRIVVLVSLLLCLALTLGSCSLTDMSFKQFYRNYDFDPAHEFTASSQITALDELAREDSAGHLILFTTNDAETLKLYNAETDSILLTFSRDNIEKCDVISVFGIPLAFVVEKTVAGEETTYASRIYDANGNKVAEAKDTDAPATAPVIKTDLFKFDDALYRVNEDGSVEMLSDNPLKSYLPDVDTKSKKFYYDIGDEEVSVYNKDLECVYYWRVPFEADESTIVLLSDGVLFAQIIEALPADVEEYDVIMDGEKVNIVSYVLNAARNSEKEVDADFVLEDQASFDEIYRYPISNKNNPPKRVNNISFVYFFKEQRMDSDYTLVTIRDNGKTFEIAPDCDNLPSPIAKNRYVYSRDNGEEYIVNARGKILANLSGQNCSNNEKFIEIDDRLYDMDLELVYDAKAKDKKVHAMLSTSVILKDAEPDADGNTKYYLYTEDGNISEIADYSEYVGQYYVTKNSSTGTLSFYNNSGSLILSVKGSSWLSVYTSKDNDVNLIRVTDLDGKAHYYKFT